jgi:uncharacterized membrane protein
MLTVREHIDVDAPVEAVFEYMDEPSRQPDITPSLTHSHLLERLPNGGARARYTYTILGLSFSGEVHATDYVPNERIVWTMQGDLKGTIRWYFQPLRDERSRFTYAATYALPGPSFLRPLLKPVVQRYNEREVHALLRRLDARLGR